MITLPSGTNIDAIDDLVSVSPSGEIYCGYDRALHLHSSDEEDKMSARDRFDLANVMVERWVAVLNQAQFDIYGV